MSCHYSYTRLLKAVTSGDLDELEEANFYLGKRVHYTPLMNGGDAVSVAIENGHQELARELLIANSDSLQSLNHHKRSWKACHLAKVACRKENIEILKMLLTICPISSWINFDLIHMVAEQGFFPLMNLIIREVQKDNDISDNPTYSLDNIIPRFLDLSLMNGNACHNEFHEEVMNQEIYSIYWRKIDPLHYAAFTKDIPELKRIIQENDEWFDIRYTPFGFLNAMSVFGLVALMGNEELLVELYHLTGDCSEYVKLRLAEEACDLACQRGRTNIIRRLLSEKWIDEHWHALWDSRVNSAFSKRRIETSHLLLDKFFSVQDDDGPPASAIRMRDLVATGDSHLVKKAITFMKETFVSDWEANNQLWEGYKHALEEGYPEILKLFIDSLGFMDEVGQYSAAVHFSSTDQVFTETMKKISKMSAVNVELLMSCYYSVNHNLPNLPSEGLAVVLAYVIRQCPENLTVSINDFLLPKMKINSIQLLDYCDLSEVDLGFMHRSDKNVDMYRLCNLFRICSGSTVHWDGLLHSAIHLNDKAFELFCKYAQHYKIAINNDRLHLERDKCRECRQDENGKLAIRYQRALDVFRYGISAPLSSLQHQCRLAIRRAIYKTNTLMSKSDRILALHKYHDYPKELVRYLLFKEDDYKHEYRDHILLNMNDIEEDYELSEEDDFYGDVLNEYEYYAYDIDDQDDFDDFLDEENFDDEFEGSVIRLA